MCTGTWTNSFVRFVSHFLRHFFFVHPPGGLTIVDEAFSKFTQEQTFYVQFEVYF